MATTVNVSPFGPKPTFFDWITGAVANGYQVFFYVAGSVNTKQNTYTDSTGTVANTNPLVLDTAGQPNNVQIWFQQGLAYKVLIATSTDSDPPTNGFVLGDFLRGINDTSLFGATSQWLAGPVPAFVNGTTFALNGDQTSNFQVNRRVQTFNAGGQVYGTITASVFAAGVTTVTILPDSGTLDAGISAVNFGIISSVNTSLPNVLPFKDNQTFLVNAADQTKKELFDLSHVSTATTRTLTVPNISGTMAVNVNSLCQGRLTLTTGVPVTTSDVLAAPTVFFTPYGGNSIAIYDGAIWNILAFSQAQLTVPAVAAQMYDVFGTNSAGSLAIQSLAWTNDTTRATALALQDGVLVNSSDHTQRYLGSFRTTVGSQTEDSIAHRFVWNYYNRLPRKMLVQETTSAWTYTTATYRQANASTTNQLDMVIGISENLVKANVSASAMNQSGVGAATQIQVGIGIDSTTTNSADLFPFSQQLDNAGATLSAVYPLLAQWSGFPGIGRHFLAWLEISQATGTTTWNGTNPGPIAGANTHSGISGEILA